MNASMGVRNLPSLPVYASIFKILPHLEGIVPVSAVAYSDNFIVGAGVFWVRLGVGGTFAPGEGAFGGVNAGVVLNQTVATAYGGVRIPTPSPRLEHLRNPRCALFQPEQHDQLAGARCGF
jgi:hypothetical protein